MEYRKLKETDINIDLFQEFQRYQKVTKCWRKVDGKWRIKDDAFIDDWSNEEYELLVECLKNTINTGGAVFGAFVNKELKGFASIESKLIGENSNYADLTSIHVSLDKRGMGIGSKLFKLITKFAKELGAKKVYISAHSAVESQAFYKAMGCTEAMEYNEQHVEAEPCDCQLEYIL